MASLEAELKQTRGQAHSLAARLVVSEDGSATAQRSIVQAQVAVQSAALEAAVLVAILTEELLSAEARIARLIMQRDTARIELQRSTSTEACCGMAGTVPTARPPPARHDARPAFAAPARAQSAPRARPEPPGTARSEPPGTARPEPPGTALPPHHDPYAHPASRAELYAAAATDGQVASRLVEYETALEAERRRASQAIAACHASQVR
jgi:hypothetical protein